MAFGGLSGVAAVRSRIRSTICCRTHVPCPLFRRFECRLQEWSPTAAAAATAHPPVERARAAVGLRLYS